ncbi:MAG: GNAT family N-acetyltransferase [Lachnospiraceae bacterium]|nr:GNAT family N-acetyltransferase [Lachnospiraceae bacterium]MBO4910834.1 GNAT family N-acetyltransferase [Lachnospiraceae bacterium]
MNFRPGSCRYGVKVSNRLSILDEFKGQGYATEAVKLVLKWAFDHSEVVAVEAESDPDNAPTGVERRNNRQ